MTSNEWQGRVVLITGTAGGQGRAAALCFAAAGAHVIGCDLNTDGNQETERQVKATGGSIVTMAPVDLGDAAQAKAWIEAAAAVHGRVDVLYNNASAARFAPFEQFSLDDWRFTIRNELDIVFHTTRYAWAWLQRQGGVVINTASVAGLAGSGPGGAAHAASKGAVIALSKQLAVEGAPHGIRVVTISPGLVDTPGTATLMQQPSARDAILAGNLIKRAGTSDEVVQAALFLASNAAAYITGANLVIDGGRLAW